MRRFLLIQFFISVWLVALVQPATVVPDNQQAASDASALSVSLATCALDYELLAGAMQKWTVHFQATKRRRATTYALVAAGIAGVGAYYAYDSGWLNDALKGAGAPEEWCKTLPKDMTEDEIKTAHKKAKLSALKQISKSIDTYTVTDAVKAKLRVAIASAIVATIVTKGTQHALPLSDELVKGCGFSDKKTLANLCQHLIDAFHAFGNASLTVQDAYRLPSGHDQALESMRTSLAPVVQASCIDLLVHTFGRVLIAYVQLSGALLAYDQVHGTQDAQDLVACVPLVNFVGQYVHSYTQSGDLCTLVNNLDVRAGMLTLMARVHELPCAVQGTARDARGARV